MATAPRITYQLVAGPNNSATSPVVINPQTDSLNCHSVVLQNGTSADTVVGVGRSAGNDLVLSDGVSGDVLLSTLASNATATMVRSYTGAGAPASTFGNNGDLAYNTSTKTFYGPKVLGAWDPASAVVAIGQAGPQGPQGIAGLSGAAGSPGSIIWSCQGAGPPSPAIGNPQDYAVNSTEANWYGPKSTGANGAWPSAASFSLKGPAGSGGGTATFPLAGTTGTTAAPSYAYGFSGFTTSGLGYDSTQSATVIYANGTPILSAAATGLARIPAKLNVGGTTAPQCAISVGDYTVNDGTLPIQINCAAGNGAYFAVTNSTSSAVASVFGYNKYVNGGYLEGTLVRSMNASPIFLMVNNSATYALSASSAGNVGIGSSTLATNKLDVFGSVGIGTGVAGATAAPANGLLVQGGAIFQGAVTFQGGATGVSSNTAVIGNAGNFTATAAQSGSVINMTQPGTLYLPAATAAMVGNVYTLANSVVADMAIQTASASDVIYYSGPITGTNALTNKSSGTNYLHYATPIGGSIRVLCLAVNKWIITDMQAAGWV